MFYFCRQLLNSKTYTENGFRKITDANELVDKWKRELMDYEPELKILNIKAKTFTEELDMQQIRADNVRFLITTNKSEHRTIFQ